MGSEQSKKQEPFEFLPVPDELREKARLMLENSARRKKANILYVQKKREMKVFIGIATFTTLVIYFNYF